MEFTGCVTTVFDKWKVEVLEQHLKKVIQVLEEFGLDEIEVPHYVLVKYSKTGSVSVFDISMLCNLLERDLKLKRARWENGYLYLRW